MPYCRKGEFNTGCYVQNVGGSGVFYRIGETIQKDFSILHSLLDMVMIPRNIKFYYGHDNPHNITWTTYLHRIRHLKRTRAEAMRVPYLGRGGDRRGKQRQTIKRLRFIDPDQTTITIIETIE